MDSNFLQKTVHDLPNETILKIFRMCKSSDFKSIRLVSKRFNALANDVLKQGPVKIFELHYYFPIKQVQNHWTVDHESLNAHLQIIQNAKDPSVVFNSLTISDIHVSNEPLLTEFLQNYGQYVKKLTCVLCEIESVTQIVNLWLLNLSVLNLRECKNTNDNVEFQDFTSQPRITTLCVRWNLNPNVDGLLIKIIRATPYIKVLKITLWEINLQVMNLIGTISTLEKLSLAVYGNRTIGIEDHLNNVSSLKHLKISIQVLSLAGLQIQKKFPKLESLKIIWIDGEERYGMNQNSFDSCKTIEKVSLLKVCNPTTVQLIINAFPNINIIHLRISKAANRHSIITMIQQLQNIQFLKSLQIDLYMDQLEEGDYNFENFEGLSNCKYLKEIHLVNSCHYIMRLSRTLYNILHRHVPIERLYLENFWLTEDERHSSRFRIIVLNY